MHLSFTCWPACSGSNIDSSTIVIDKSLHEEQFQLTPRLTLRIVEGLCSMTPLDCQHLPEYVAYVYSPYISICACRVYM